MRCVDDCGAKSIIRVCKHRGDRREILAAMGRQTSIHIFKNNHPRSAASLYQASHQLPEGPKRARTGRCVVSFATEAPVTPRERKVLAGKRGPCEVDNSAGQICERKACDVAALDIARAPVGFVSRNLLLIEVIGEQAAPRVPSPARAMPPPAKNSTKVCLVMLAPIWIRLSRRACFRNANRPLRAPSPVDGIHTRIAQRFPVVRYIHCSRQDVVSLLVPVPAR